MIIASAEDSGALFSRLTSLNYGFAILAVVFSRGLDLRGLAGVRADIVSITSECNKYAPYLPREISCSPSPCVKRYSCRTLITPNT